MHDKPTFAVILDGGFDLCFSRTTQHRKRLGCSAGTVFVEPAGERHSNHVGKRGAHVVVVQPDLASADSWRPFASFLTEIQHFNHGGLALDARRLAREIRQSDSFSTLATEALALQMLVEAGRHSTPVHAPVPRPAWLERVDEYVHESFRDNPSINDVAAVASIHPSHLATVFRHVYNVPLGTYLRRLRLEWCRDRLLESEQPISAIAYAAGYSDQSHLTRDFKRFTGTTPAKFRTTHRRRGFDGVPKLDRRDFV